MKVGTDGVLIGAWADVGDAENILDIGTGTGLIALMLAQKSRADIDAIEIETSACQQALENVAQSVWKGRITVIHSMLQDYAKKADKKYGLIVTNPPFFSNSLKGGHNARDMARHNDTLLPEDLLLGANKLLFPLGRFCIILPYIEAQLFIVDAALHNLYCIKKTNIYPLAHKKPSRVLMEFSRERKKMVEDNLIIRNQSGTFTDDYKLMTSDFYLNF